jgi:hypothetical protein
MTLLLFMATAAVFNTANLLTLKPTLVGNKYGLTVASMMLLVGVVGFLLMV